MHEEVKQGVCYGFTGLYTDRTWRFYENYLKRYQCRPRRILDVGSGLGLFLECCQHHDIQAVGLEYNRDVVDQCNARGLKAIQCDLSRPFALFPDEVFDAVFSFQVIEHLDRNAQINMLRESFRVLRRGGEIMVDSPSKYYHEATRASSHIGLLSPKELANLAESVGFKNIDMRFTYPQYPPDIPKEVVDDIWGKYHPDILSQTSTILASKL